MSISIQVRLQSVLFFSRCLIKFSKLYTALPWLNMACQTRVAIDSGCELTHFGIGNGHFTSLLNKYLYEAVNWTKFYWHCHLYHWNFRNYFSSTLTTIRIPRKTRPLHPRLTSSAWYETRPSAAPQQTEPTCRRVYNRWREVRPLEQHTLKRKHEWSE